MPSTAGAEVAPGVVARVEERIAAARELLSATVARREEAVGRLVETGDPDDALVARTFNDFLLQVDEMRTNGSALVVATGADGDPVVGRMAVLDPDKEVVLVPWHAPAGQRHLLAPDRLLATEHPDGSVALHRLTADDTALADTIRARMRAAAVQDRMSDPLATLTEEQGRALATITAAPGDVVLTGPPGSGKSAIVMVELARRMLSADLPSRHRVLFVTGTTRLARRAEALTRLLGTASVVPVPQSRILAHLGVSDEVTPPASADDGDLALPRALDAAFAARRDLLASDRPVPHPLGQVPADEIASVLAVRARAATQSYRDSSRALAAAVVEEYQQLVPGESSRRAAEAACQSLRPATTPTDLLRAVGASTGLARPIRAAATAYARRLLDGSPRTDRADWDLVVVDEYQRLPDVVLALLRRRATTVLLSGDPLQSFAGGDAAAWLGDAEAVSLSTSLRLPSSIAAWIDAFWADHGQPPPEVRSAAAGGAVHRVDDLPDDPEAAVIAPVSRIDRASGSDWLDPAEAVGLEWPHVVVVAPEEIWREHGPAGLFIAASRAIDHLTVVEQESS
ncbi:AAA family ATPase [Salsipaludibacter albus]|uniref:AAA family ATPase n=1 Tax=Salsipaludibacter albus TaxID=2849650 RepID=UPI001EE3DC9E|nr:AAA family ATPase [Salsipaludibacter albus]MBY5161141.1 AAA family ATPase [Salsipaludibacter albus]